jgi:hypothetical protein
MMTILALLVVGGAILVAWNLYAAIAGKNDPHDGTPQARLHLVIAIAIASGLILVLNSMHR